MISENQRLIAYVILVVLLNGFFSINIIEKNKRFYNSQLNNQMAVTETLRSELTEFYKYGVVVDVTMYRPNVRETDSTPNITADGTHIRISKASDYKYVALARNLLKRWGGPFDYGDFILLNPPFKTSTILLWILPFIFFLIAIVVLYWHNKNSKKNN